MSNDEFNPLQDAMNEVHWHRKNGFTLRFNVMRGVSCHKCGHNEIVKPGQTMDMPMHFKCLGCGENAPSFDFDHYNMGELEQLYPDLFEK
jgi:hypothetical protein